MKRLFNAGISHHFLTGLFNCCPSWVIPCHPTSSWLRACLDNMRGAQGWLGKHTQGFSRREYACVQTTAVVGIPVVVVDKLSAVEHLRTPRREWDPPGSPACPWVQVRGSNQWAAHLRQVHCQLRLQPFVFRVWIQAQHTEMVTKCCKTVYTRYFSVYDRTRVYVYFLKCISSLILNCVDAVSFCIILQLVSIETNQDSGDSVR
jgi:hypothetical protein